MLTMNPKQTRLRSGGRWCFTNKVNQTQKFEAELVNVSEDILVFKKDGGLREIADRKNGNITIGSDSYIMSKVVPTAIPPQTVSTSDKAAYAALRGLVGNNISSKTTYRVTIDGKQWDVRLPKIILKEVA